MHDVVPDLHVVEDLRQRERGRAREPGGREEADEEQRAAPDLEAPLDLDHAADVVGVALAAVFDDALADGVELGSEGLELLRGELDQFRLVFCVEAAHVISHSVGKRLSQLDDDVADRC